jgi:hypothetical protein
MTLTTENIIFFSSCMRAFVEIWAWRGTSMIRRNFLYRDWHKSFKRTCTIFFVWIRHQKLTFVRGIYFFSKVQDSTWGCECLKIKKIKTKSNFLHLIFFDVKRFTLIYEAHILNGIFVNILRWKMQKVFPLQSEK